MEQYDFGIVGLGVMGRNLLLNMADHGFAVAGLDLDSKKVASLQAEAENGHQVTGVIDAKTFAGKLKKPRAIMLLVPAGKPVDAAIASLTPYLGDGDIVIDGGNTYFPDTDRRVSELGKQNIHFFGMGISGGEKGARFGPSLMPGGNRDAYERLRPIFEAIAAKVDGEPCVEFLGNGSAGNYVKMVHNGIEYGIMQTISEVYDLLKRGLGFSDQKLEDIFVEWNNNELQSFLVEITGKVLAKFDDENRGRLVNFISDAAHAKGTGKWTSQNAMDLQVPISVIDAAVVMRDLSIYKEERLSAAQQYKSVDEVLKVQPEEDFSNVAKDALFFTMLITYAQGLSQLAIASKEYNYNLNLEHVAKIWRGGCIIRSNSLEDFRQAFNRNPDLKNILLDERVGEQLIKRDKNVRKFVKTAINAGIPVAAVSAALAYFDAYRSAVLPTNLIQGQRDFFGAHTYERIDIPGVFHTKWE